MKRYSFFVDFDDTIVPTKHLVAQYLSNKYNVPVETKDLTDNNGFNKTILDKGVTVGYNEVYLDFGKNFFPNFGIKDFIFYPGAKDAIERLSEIYNLYIVTSRQEEEKENLKNILKFNNVLECFQDIHCVWKWGNNHFVEDSKTSFMKRQEGTNIGFLDDSLAEIKSATKESIIYPVLFDPYGTHKGESFGYDVCSSWEKVKKTFS